jgi:hypothetical protein
MKFLAFQSKSRLKANFQRSAAAYVKVKNAYRDLRSAGRNAEATFTNIYEPCCLWMKRSAVMLKDRRTEFEIAPGSGASTLFPPITKP